jgi:hypothetical protein
MKPSKSNIFSYWIFTARDTGQEGQPVAGESLLDRRVRAMA